MRAERNAREVSRHFGKRKHSEGQREREIRRERETESVIGEVFL